MVEVKSGDISCTEWIQPRTLHTGAIVVPRRAARFIGQPQPLVITYNVIFNVQFCDIKTYSYRKDVRGTISISSGICIVILLAVYWTYGAFPYCWMVGSTEELELTNISYRLVEDSGLLRKPLRRLPTPSRGPAEPWAGTRYVSADNSYA